MVASLDGFIAKKDNTIDWMYSTDHYDAGKVLTEMDIAEFVERVDCYVMGSKTYEHAMALGWPYGDKPVIVVTHRNLRKIRDSVEWYTGDLERLVNEHLRPAYDNIWMVGGANLTKEFIRKNLADEVVVSIMPVILGDGLPFFEQIGEERQLHLKDVKAYRDGMVELSYEIKN